ncbi:MAG: hypothetical protein SWK76_06660 [Actinomycetota bacterium]|nr:hypothetical protein [Actinomycetota bacterium]
MRDKNSRTARDARAPLRALLSALSIGTLAVPPFIIISSGTSTANPTWTALRLAALLAFTLIFLNIVTGAFRPSLNRVFRARALQRVHVAIGLTGFSLALAHGILAAIYGLAGFNPVVVAVGPAVLVLLAATILTALTRHRLRRTWRWVHRLNYVIFAAVFIHALILGYDLRDSLLLRVFFVIYVILATAGLLYRIYLSLEKRRPRPSEA